MNNNKMTILFLLHKHKVNKKGKCPIRCRITYMKKRKEFSLGLFLNPDYWFSKQQKAIPPNPDNSYINTQLSLVSQKINEAFLFLQVNDKTFDVEDIYLRYKGENIKAHKTLLEVFELHNVRIYTLIGIEYTNSTYRKFIETKKHTANFIKHQYAKNDILLESIKMNFLQDFDFYLKSELNHKQITINKSIQRVRKIIKLALAEGYLKKDPFILYKPKRYETKVVFLNKEELKALEDYQFAQARLTQVRDMFVFCCYTGLAYAEMSNLSKEHLINGFDGNTWIKMYRKKTNSIISVPLLNKAKEILKVYSYDKNLLPVITNQKFNSYLKEISVIVGIDKRLTHHIARKTFATTVLLYNNVPMEIVSELLGHSKIQITQKHYAKVVQRSISEELKRLEVEFKKKANFL